MKGSVINQLKVYLMMLSGRFGGGEYFIDAEISFKSGTKIFPAKVEKSENGLTIAHGGGVKPFVWADVASLAQNYDSMTLVYRERGTNAILTADDRGASLKYEDSAAAPQAETATVGTREYLIAPPKAAPLLKEIGIMTAEGKIKNDMVRKYNQIDHFVELVSDYLKRLGDNVEVLDCACGKSYLSFALNYYLKDVLKKNCHVTGVDYSEVVINASRRMAENLGYGNMTFIRADLTDFTPNRRPDVVISLHACDTATDMAIAAGINNGAKAIFAVPCCHRELLNSYSYAPFEGILRHGIFKARQADLLTDGMRCLLLEAAGYTVTAQEYISPVETPKNLLIRAFKDKAPSKRAREEYYKLKEMLGAGIRLEKLIEGVLK
ncbi:MAG: class I SAM-dependent methyltransferase [Clostridia bacterium]